ncbi:MAG: DUF2130 domain-containing protein [Bacteroidetes bacterium]|nr:DUF2130 domain-containing protein [Bacteroidota bacterium]
MSNNSTVRCPNCQHEFPIGNALAQEIEGEIRGKYLKRYQEDKLKMEAEKAQLAQESEKIKLQAENQEQIIADKMRAAKQQLEQEAIKKAAGEMQLQMEALNKELLEKSQRLKESQVKELELMQKEKQLREREESLKLDLEKQMQEKQKEIEERAKKMEGEKYALKFREMEKKLADQVELTEVMQRKMEQGSMQLQGEVQELALEELLRSTFPFDVVEEVAKGIKGADCIHHVRNHLAQPCGKIIYESKRTKAFSNDWIDKLKTDMRSQQADMAILVTETLPKDMDSFGFREGVWICRFADIKAIAFILRDTLIKINTAVVSQENKADKAHLIYSYVTGVEFRQNIEAILEGWLALKDGITREKIQMEKIWKEREKQIDKTLTNTAQFYGSIKGIAGNAVGDIKLLE